MAARTTLLCITGGIVGSGLLALHCTNGDSPLPAIDPNGQLLVSPCTYTFPVAAGDDAGVSPPVVFVVQGSVPGGLGADSVPVTVSVGQCATDAGAMDPTGSCEQGTNYTQAPSVEWSRVELVPIGDGGCSAASNQLLLCTLSADGLARFGVATPPPAVSTEGQYIPICVRPLPQTMAALVEVLIADALEGGALQVDVPNDGAIAAQPVSGACSSLLVSCSSLNRQLPVALDLVQGASNAVAQQTVSAKLSINPGASGVWLSGTPCGAATTPIEPTSLDVELPSGASVANVAYICVDEKFVQYGSPYTLTASSVTQPTLGVASRSIVVAAQPAEVQVSAGPGEDAGTVFTVEVLDCQGGQVTQGPTVVGRGQTVVDNLGDDAGGISFLVESAPDAGATVQVVLGGASSCTEALGGNP
jgi:hypothetical protein